MSDFVIEFLHASDEEKTKAKAIKIWDRRPRVSRNEALVDLVGEMRSLMETIRQGCRAKTPAAQAARDAVKGLNERLEQVVGIARKIEVVPLHVDRKTR
jgi:hypothetical protein